jgi:hypothetical protein
VIVAADLQFQPNLDASFGALLDKSLMDLRILILVVDLCAAGASTSSVFTKSST